MIATEPMFLETVSPEIRKALVYERLAAMRGHLSEACARLETHVAVTPPDKLTDLVALGLLWSEVLYLDGQVKESLAVFNTVVEPRTSALPIPVQLVATDNLSIMQMEDSPREGVSTFYHLVDRRRVAQFEACDRGSLLVAQSAIERERYAEALPLLWQHLLRAYCLGSWRESRWAAESLANLNLKVGSLEQAAHYLIVAQADTDVERLADAIAFRRDPDLTRDILRQLIEFANLRRHFEVACKLIAKVPDFIPDEEVDSLAQWLLPRCRERAARNGGGVMRAAWEAVRRFGHRVSPGTSQMLIVAALSHPEWQAPVPEGNRVLPNRHLLVEAVTFLVHSAPPEYLPEVADATLPLAIERIQNHDYAAVINLLCNLSQHGGGVLRNKIKVDLYVPEKPVNRVLAQVSSFFEIEALDSMQWEQFAKNVIDEIRLTVQRLKPGETHKPVAETLMTLTRTTPQGELKLVVHGAVGLQALSKEKHRLSDETIEQIVRVLVEMATNKNNLLSNRELLLSQLCQFAERAHADLCDEVVRAIEPLARGEVSESTDYPSSAADNNPYSSTKMDTGTPQQVRAVALIAAATYCGSNTSLSRSISEALMEGFVDSDVTVRRGAYAAARRLPDLSGEQLLPILMGLRDPDPSAAVAAFSAFAVRNEWSLTRPMWKLLLLATRLASQSTNANLRRHAAITLRKRLSDVPTGRIRADADAVLQVLSSDAAHSVREAAVNVSEQQVKHAD